MKTIAIMPPERAFLHEAETSDVAGRCEEPEPIRGYPEVGYRRPPSLAAAS